MADEVKIPISLEVTDLDLSQVNPKDIDKGMKDKLTDIRKTIDNVFKSLDTSYMSKEFSRTASKMNSSFRTVESTVKNLSKTIKDLDSGKASMEQVEKAAKDVASAMSNTDNVFKEFSADAQVESTLTAGFRNSYTIAKDLVQELKYYEGAAEKAAESSNTSAEYWERLDVYTKATKENLRGVLAELRAMVKDGSAFKLGSVSDTSTYSRMIQSLQGAGQMAYGRTTFLSGQAGAEAPQALVKAKTEVIQLEHELEKAQWKFEALKKTDVGTTAIREAEADVANLTTRLEVARTEFESLSNSIYGVNQATVETATSAQEVATGMYISDEAAETLNSTLNKILDAISEIAIASNEVGEETSDSFEKAGNKIDNTKHKSKMLNETFQATRNVTTAMIMTLQQFGSIGTIIAQVIGIVQLLADAFRDVALAAHSVIPIVGLFVGLAINIFGRLISILKKIIALLKQIGLAILSVAQKIGGVLSSAVKKVASILKSVIPSKDTLKKIKDFFSKYLLGFRSSYFLIRKIRQTVIDGLKDLAKAAPEFKEQLNDFYRGLNQVKGGLVSAFQPIVSFVIPALNALFSALSRVLTAIAKFNAVLVGQDYYYDYAASMEDYVDGANSASKATKKLQKDLMGFDEINRLSAPSEPSGSGGSGLGGTFTKTMVDKEDAISNWAKRIREAWIEGYYDENGEYVFVQSFEDSIKKLYDVFEDLGWTIATKINDGLLKFNYSSTHGFKNTAEKIAVSLGALINGFVERPFFAENLGAAIANAFNLAFTFLYKFATTVHWDSVGDFIGTGIASALETFNWNNFFVTIATFINGLASLITNAVSGKNWGQIGASIAEGLLDGLDHFDAAAAGRAINDFFTAIADAIGGFAAKMSEESDWVLESVTGYGPNGRQEKWVKENGWTKLGKKINTVFREAMSKDLADTMGSVTGQMLNGIIDAITPSELHQILMDFVDSFLGGMSSSEFEAKLNEYWENTLSPALDKIIDWAGPKIEQLLNKLWEVISGPLFEFGKKILGSIWDGIKSAYGSAVQDFYTNVALSPIGISRNLSDKYDPSEFQDEDDEDRDTDKTSANLQKDIQKWKKQIKEFKDSDEYKNLPDYMKKQYDTYAQSWDNVSDTVKQANTNIADSSKQTSDSVTQNNDKVQKSTQQTSKVAQESSAKIQTSSQTNQQSFTETASSANTMTDSLVNGFNVMQSASDAALGSIEPAAADAYAGMVSEFDGATSYFDTMWSNITSGFQVDGVITQGLAVGMNAILTGSANKLIDAINTYAMTPLIRLDALLDKIRNINFAGATPFAGIPKLGFAKIPRLAQGAVLPPNQPFLSIVGDQKRGTNIEAPLETIQQAVANVMGDNTEAILAMGEAIVRAIQNKDMSVRIGDKDIYNANRAYEQRINLMRGV